MKLKPYPIILSKYYCSSHFPDWKVKTQQPIASFKVKYTDMKYTRCLVKWLDLPCAGTKQKPLWPQILQYFITASRKSGVRFDFPRVDLVAAMKCRHVGIWGLNYHTGKHQTINFLLENTVNSGFAPDCLQFHRQADKNLGNSLGHAAKPPVLYQNPKNPSCQHSAPKYFVRFVQKNSLSDKGQCCL